MSFLKIGIVGGAGQVGTALMRAFTLEPDLLPVAICRNKLSAARLACQRLPVRIVRTDDPEQLSEATKDLEVVINCALPLYGPSRTSASNRSLAVSLARACAGKRLIHLSSIAVYGEFTRSSPSRFKNPKPDSVYGRQKLQMEKMLCAHVKRYSVACMIVRVGHVYGPEMNWSQVFVDLLQNQSFQLPFGGSLASNAVSVSNVVIALRQHLAKDSWPAVANLTNYPQSSWREIFDLHAEASNFPPARSLGTPQSQVLALDYKKWADTGLAARIVSETWSWLKGLPSSLIASVPSLKDLFSLVLHQIASGPLEIRLRAAYHAVAREHDKADAPGILPCFVSEPMPGRYLTYNGKSPFQDLPALRSWCQIILNPAASVVVESVSRKTIPSEQLSVK